MSICLSDFEDSLVVEFLQFLLIMLDLLSFFLIIFDFGGYSLELCNRLFGDDKLCDNFFDMIVEVILFVFGGSDGFELIGDGCHLSKTDKVVI